MEGISLLSVQDRALELSFFFLSIIQLYEI